MIMHHQNKYINFIYTAYTSLCRHRIAFYFYTNLVLFFLLDLEFIDLAAFNFSLILFDVPEVIKFFKFRSSLNYFQTEITAHLVCLSSINGV